MLRHKEQQQQKDTEKSNSEEKQSNPDSIQNKPLQRISSRASSFDSNPGSPFQNNPLLVSHDYAKSPMMEDHCSETSSLCSLPTKEETKVLNSEPPQEMPKDFDPKVVELNEPQRFAPKDLLALLRNIETDISTCESVIKDENEKRKKHKIDDCRRVHNYDEFITTFITMLAEQGLLADLLENGLNPKKKEVPSNSGSQGSGNNSNSGNRRVTGNANKVSRSGSNRSSSHRRGRPKKRK